MSIFMAPSLARSGFDYSPVKRLAIYQDFNSLSKSADVSQFRSPDLDTFKQTKLRGDLLATAASGYLSEPGPSPVRNNSMTRNGRLILFVSYSPDVTSNNAYPVVFVSDDGSKFDRRNVPFGLGLKRGWGGWCLFGSRIIAFLTTGESCYSDDNADTWTLGLTVSGMTIFCAAASGSAVVVGGLSSGNSGIIAYSTNPAGVAFTSVNPGFGTKACNCITFANGLFVANGYSILATAGALPTTWTSRSTSLSGNNAVVSILYAPNYSRWFADTFASGEWITSANGTAWTDASTTMPYWGSNAKPSATIPYVDLAGDLIMHWGKNVSRFTGSGFEIHANNDLPDQNPLMVGQLAA